VRYSGIQQIQLDTAKYDIQLDTVGHSGIQWICCKMARQGHSEIPRIR